MMLKIIKIFKIFGVSKIDTISNNKLIIKLIKSKI